MYKNFEKLNSKIFLEKNQDEIFRKIKTLFDYLENNELENFGNYLRKTLELSLNAFAFLKFKKTLSNGLRNKIKELEENIYFDSKVHQSILFLRYFCNRESHSQNSYGRPSYNLKIDVHEAKVALRFYWLLLKWMRIKINDDYDEEIQDADYKEGKLINTPIESEEFKNLRNNNNDIKALTNTFGQLVISHNYRFTIPVYQRDYTWSIDNINKLQNDLLDRFEDKKTHYFGALAIAIDKKKKLFKIIDGQQRITTAILIFKSFYEFMKEKNLKIPDELNKFILQKIEKIYINQDVLTSQKSITRIIKNRFVPTDSQLDKKAWNNMLHFKKFLETNDQKNINIVDLYRTFVQNFELAVLYFDTSLEEEMDIFTNLNTGGIQLKNWDLIRNFLFSKLDEDFMIENEKDINSLINRTFLVPLNDCTNNKPGNALKEFFTIYLRYEFIFKNSEIFLNEGKDFPLYEGFKKVWNINNGSKKIKSYKLFKEKIDEIEKILKIYIEIKYGYKRDILSKLNPYSHKIDLICNKLDFIPIIIKSIFDNCNLKDNRISKLDDKTIELFEMIESYLVKSAAYGNNMSKNMDGFLLKNKTNNQNFNDTFWIFLKNETTYKLESNDWFQEMIKVNNIKLQVKINILINLEHKIKKINTFSTQQIKFAVSNEHIISQKTNFNDYDDKTISKEEFNDLHFKYNDHLGNLLILSQKDNSKASKKPFLEKKEVYETYGLANNDIEKIGLMHLTKFTYEDVKERTKALANYIINNKIYYEK